MKELQYAIVSQGGSLRVIALEPKALGGSLLSYITEKLLPCFIVCLL